MLFILFKISLCDRNYCCRTRKTYSNPPNNPQNTMPKDLKKADGPKQNSPSADDIEKSIAQNKTQLQENQKISEPVVKETNSTDTSVCSSIENESSSGNQMVELILEK